MTKNIELKRLLTSGALLGALSLSVVTPLTVNAATSFEGETSTNIEFKQGEVPPIDPEEPGVVVPPEGGNGSFALQAVPAAWNFGSSAVSGQDSTHSGVSANHGMVRVADLRGTYAGWNLQARLVPLTAVEGEDGGEVESRASQQLVGTTITVPATLREFNITDNTLMDLDPDNAQNPTLNESIVINSNNTGIKRAAEGKGLGVWQTTFATPELTIIGGQAQADTEYTGSIVWTLQDTP